MIGYSGEGTTTIISATQAAVISIWAFSGKRHPFRQLHKAKVLVSPARINAPFTATTEAYATLLLQRRGNQPGNRMADLHSAVGTAPAERNYYWLAFGRA